MTYITGMHHTKAKGQPNLRLIELDQVYRKNKKHPGAGYTFAAAVPESGVQEYLRSSRHAVRRPALNRAGEPVEGMCAVFRTLDR